MCLRAAMLLVLAISASGCSHRKAGPADGGAIDAGIDAPRDAGTDASESGQPGPGGCRPTTAAAAAFAVDPLLVENVAADLRLALHASFVAREATGTAAGVWAGVADSPLGVHAFWLVRPQTGASVVDDAAAAEAALGLAVAEAFPLRGGAVASVQEGRAAAVLEGAPAEVSAVRWSSFEEPVRAGRLRDEWLKRLAPRGMSIILPASVDAELSWMTVGSFVVRRADGTAVHVGVVVDRDAYEDDSSTVSAVADTLVDGTAVADSRHWLTSECEAPRGRAAAKIDVLVHRPHSPPPYEYTLDPPYGLDWNRMWEYSRALYDELQRSGADVRLTVAYAPPGFMGDPRSVTAIPLCPGGFSPLSTFTYDDFDACLHEDGWFAFHGIWAGVQSALPADGGPSHFRPDAVHLAVLLGGDIVFSEPPAFSFHTPFDLPPTEVRPIELWMLPMLADLRDAAVVLHTIHPIGTPRPPCPSLMHTATGRQVGYAGAAQVLGGEAHDFCFGDPGVIAHDIVQSALAGSVRFPLGYVPVSITLGVASRSGPLVARHRQGFRYLGLPGNALNTTVDTPAPGEEATIHAAYYRWTTEPPG